MARWINHGTKPSVIQTQEYMIATIKGGHWYDYRADSRLCKQIIFWVPKLSSMLSNVTNIPKVIFIYPLNQLCTFVSFGEAILLYYLWMWLHSWKVVKKDQITAMVVNNWCNSRLLANNDKSFHCFRFLASTSCFWLSWAKPKQKVTSLQYWTLD